MAAAARGTLSSFPPWPPLPYPYLSHLSSPCIPGGHLFLSLPFALSSSSLGWRRGSPAGRTRSGRAGPTSCGGRRGTCAAARRAQPLAAASGARTRRRQGAGTAARRARPPAAPVAWARARRPGGRGRGRDCSVGPASCGVGGITGTS